MDINSIFLKLKNSHYRRKFRLRDKERAYLAKRGVDAIREDAVLFLRERIAPALPHNDGHQTPMRNHPVFIAQHATGTCCRKCIEKWHKIPVGKELSDEEVNILVNIIMEWIERELIECIEHPFIRPRFGWGAE